MAASNSRFAVIDYRNKRVDIYEKRVLLNYFDFVNGEPPSADDVEWARTYEFKDKA